MPEDRSAQTSQGPEVVLGILSRGRLESLRRTVNSALSLAGCPIHIFVAFDDDYRTYQAYDPPPNVSKILLNPRHYYVWGMNEVYSAIKGTGSDVFAITNNDVEFIKPGWARETKKMLFESFENGMGVVEMTNTGGLFTFMTRVPFVERRWGGMLFDPVYRMYFADTDRMEDLEANNLYLHPIPGFAFSYPGKEETSYEVKKFMDRDQLTFRRMHPGVLEEKHAQAGGAGGARDE